MIASRCERRFTLRQEPSSQEILDIVYMFNWILVIFIHHIMIAAIQQKSNKKKKQKRYSKHNKIINNFDKLRHSVVSSSTPLPATCIVMAQLVPVNSDLWICWSCGRKNFDVDASKLAAECLKCSDLVTSLRRWPGVKTDFFINRYSLTSSVVCEICTMCSWVSFFLFFDFTLYMYMYILSATDFGE